VQTVMYAALPLEESIQSVLKLDPHPPLYYVMLHAWMQVSLNEYWIRLNSIIWSMLTLVVIFYVTRRWYGPMIAGYAALCFAVAPFAVFHSQQVRMYSFLMCMAIAAVYFADKFVSDSKPISCAALALILTLCLHAHGMGVLVALSVCSYIGLGFFSSPRSDREFPWAFVTAIAAAMVASYPALVRNTGVFVRHTQAPGPAEVIEGLSVYLFGMFPLPITLQWVGVIAMGILLGFASHRSRRARDLLIAFFLVPLFATLAVSHLLRPVWLPRTFAFTLPVVCIVMSTCIGSVSVKRVEMGGRDGVYKIPILIAGTVIAVFFSATLYQQLHPFHFMNFRAAAAHLRSSARPGELIFVPNERVLWGLAWYYIGPGSIHPLHLDSLYSPSIGPPLVVGNATTSQRHSVRTWEVIRDRDSVRNPSQVMVSEIWDFERLKVVHRRASHRPPDAAVSNDIPIRTY
jgi:uncharacterized membrane protein